MPLPIPGSRSGEHSNPEIVRGNSYSPTMSEFAVSVLALAVAVGSAGVAVWSVIYARRSANASVVSADAATRTADLAEVVEMGRHHGWRIEARTNDPTRFYALRNVGTINARDVKLSGNFYKVGFLQQDGDEGPVDIASGQARLFSVKHSYSRRGGELHITWTPDLPGAEPMAWTEVPPMAPAAEPSSSRIHTRRNQDGPPRP